MRTCLLRSLSIYLLSLLFITGCSSKIARFDEFASYRQDPNTLRLPTIIVPGIKGSKLYHKKDDVEVWGESWTATFIYTFDELEFPLSYLLNESIDDKFKEYYYIKRETEVKGILDSYRIALPGIRLFKVPIYDEIGKVLKDIGGYNDKYDLFYFAYDWRLDNRFSAVRLAELVRKTQHNFKEYYKEKHGDKFKDEWEKLKKRPEDLFVKDLKDEDGDYVIKVNIIAHSMGGLVSRYYHQMLGGWKNINKLIMFGTPNQGAMDSLKIIAEGEYPEAIFHFYHIGDTRKIVFSWPSVFQLLPRYPKSLLKEKENAPVDSLADWGLGNKEITETDLDEAIENWSNHNLIPSHDEVSSQQDVKKFLRQQLKDAHNFHKAINGSPDDEYEKNKLKQIKRFYKGHENVEDVNWSVPENVSAETAQFIVFGGHCEPTLKTATVFSGHRGSSSRLDFKKRDDASYGKTAINTYGDGRVPIVSLEPKKKNNKNDFRFLICEDHVGLVKNVTFQYNLLHELLKHNNTNKL